MNDLFEYRGYFGSAEVDIEGEAVVGKLQFIRDTITYSAKTPAELKTAFQEAVDDYLATCLELGDEPDVPFKGSFNVRVGPELHRKLSFAARRKGEKLNEYIVSTLSDAVDARCVNHYHHHQLLVTGDSITKTVAAGQGELEWENLRGSVQH